MVEKVWAFAATMIVVALAGASAWSCSNMNQRYYEGMKACLDQGGSWVPQGQNGYSSSCINPHSTK